METYVIRKEKRGLFLSMEDSLSQGQQLGLVPKLS